MHDTISRQDAINAIMCEPMDAHYPSWYANRIKALPSADAIEVIRCKDCKYWHREIHNGIEYFNFNSCDLNHYGDGHNFYCADGERREP